MSNNLVGQVVANQFRVESFISAGGMGTVFRVWDLKRNVPLAMKVLHTELAEDQVNFERFKREARALRNLEHPNIIPFYGLYQTPSLIFLLQRFIDGPTLKELLAQQAGQILPIQDILCITKALCSAVGFAHNNGVIHCDIKPANVMIDIGGQVYLGDFGIARHAESDMTSIFTGAGTAAYMAPEQIVSSIVTKETDIYSIGILLFELFTGQRPFRGTETGTEKSGNTVNERIRYAQINLPPPDPSLFNPNVSPYLSANILCALEKDPATRFSTCQELFSSLCDCFNTFPNQIPDRLSTIKTVQAQTPSLPQEKIPESQKTTSEKKPVAFIVTGVATAIFIFFLIAFRGTVGPQSLPISPTVTVEVATLPLNAFNITQAAGLANETETRAPQKTATQQRAAPTQTPTDDGSCADGIAQRAKVGDKVKICTTEDRLILRTEPNSDANEIFRMYPGLKVVIIDGPTCGSQHTWFKVRVAAGSWVWDGQGFVTEEEVVGWVREGGAEGDLYYICPVE